MFATLDWKISPGQLIGTDEPGLTGGVALAASGLVLNQIASYNVIRLLNVTQDLGLHQTDYWFESPSDAMIMTDAGVPVQDKPRSITSTMTLSQAAGVSGGQHYNPTIYEALGDSPIPAGWALWLKNTGHVDPAQAAVAEPDSMVVGVAIAGGGGITPAPVYYRTYGHVELSDWTGATGSATLTPGKIYYLSAATAGMITYTAPTGDGNVVVKIGTALTTNVLNLEIGEGVIL